MYYKASQFIPTEVSQHSYTLNPASFPNFSVPFPITALCTRRNWPAKEQLFVSGFHKTEPCPAGNNFRHFQPKPAI